MHYIRLYNCKEPLQGKASGNENSKLITTSRSTASTTRPRSHKAGIRYHGFCDILSPSVSWIDKDSINNKLIFV